MAARIGGIMKAPQKALVAVSRWQRIFSDKASNLPKRDVRFILLK